MAKYMIHPVKDRITQGFRANPAWYRRIVGQKGHNGIDYGSSYGTPVKATADGTVVFEGFGQRHPWMGGVAGLCILLKHRKAYSGYCHLSRTIVNNGQKVKRGQVIGYTGNTGKVTGPHLHFETFPLNPDFANGFYGRVDPATFKLGKPDSKPAPKPVAKPKPSKTPVITYIITRPGEGLSSIAKRAGFKDFGSDERWRYIARLNKSGNWKTFNKNLKPGQKVRVR